MQSFFRICFVLVFIFAGVLLESQAEARRICPPGTHWSYRYRVCVVNRHRPHRICPHGYHWSRYYRVCVPNRY